METISQNTVEYIYIGFWRRLVAKILDDLILSPLIAAYLYNINWFKHNKIVLPVILYYLFIIAYSVFFSVNKGGTPGMLIMKMKIVDLQGQNISYKSGFMRLFLYYPIAVLYLLAYFYVPKGQWNDILRHTYDIVIVLYIIDYVIIAFTKKKRALHDYFARSYVVSNKSGDGSLNNIDL